MIQQNGVSLIDSLIIEIPLTYMRISSNNKWLIFWMFDSATTSTRLEIRNFANFSKLKYDRIFSSSSYYEEIYDCDYTDTDQVWMTTRDIGKLIIYYHLNNQQIIETSALLQSITIFSTGVNSVAYSGIESNSGLQATYFIFHPIDML